MENSVDHIICDICTFVPSLLWKVSPQKKIHLSNQNAYIHNYIYIHTYIESISLSKGSYFRYQVCWTLSWDKIKTFGDNWNWKRWNTIPTTTVNTSLAHHAITMLSLCYIPGLIAAFLQLIRGTKYSRFPNWLDKWLRMRKQLGLLMLFSASLHVSLYIQM